MRRSLTSFNAAMKNVPAEAFVINTANLKKRGMVRADLTLSRLTQMQETEDERTPTNNNAATSETVENRGYVTRKVERGEKRTQTDYVCPGRIDTNKRSRMETEEEEDGVIDGVIDEHDTNDEDEDMRGDVDQIRMIVSD